MYSLLDDYEKYMRIIKSHNNGELLDISNERFLAPATLLPLISFIDKNNIQEIKVHPNTEEYVERILNKKETSTTIPFQVLPESAQERQDIN